jgi:hypothetical protein
MIGEMMKWKKRFGSGSILIKELSAYLPAGDEDHHI